MDLSDVPIMRSRGAAKIKAPPRVKEYRKNRLIR
jgi:hypothetical protein